MIFDGDVDVAGGFGGSDGTLGALGASIVLPFLDIGGHVVDLSLGCILADRPNGEVQIAFHRAPDRALIIPGLTTRGPWAIGTPAGFVQMSVLVGEVIGFGGPVQGSTRNYSAHYGALPRDSEATAPYQKRYQVQTSASRVTSFAVSGSGVNQEAFSPGDLLVALLYHDNANPGITEAPPGWFQLPATPVVQPAGAPTGGSLVFTNNPDGTLGASVVGFRGGFSYATSLSVWFRVADQGDATGSRYTWSWTNATRATVKLFRYGSVGSIASYAIELHNPFERSFPSGGGSLPGIRTAPITNSDLEMSVWYISGEGQYTPPELEQTVVAVGNGIDFEITRRLALDAYSYYLFATRIGFQAMAPTCITCPPSCPPGQAYSKVDNVCFDLPYCSPGQLWDPATAKCVAPTPAPSCPSGFLWDTVARTCVSQNPAQPTCPSGYLWDTVQRTCVGAPVCPTCPPPTQPPVCPSGYFWDTVAKKCIQISCIQGFAWDTYSRTCVPRFPCKSGQAYDPNNQICWTPQGQPSCPTGQAWDTAAQRCVTVYAAPPTCPSGYLWDTFARACVSRVTLPSCPPDHLWDTEAGGCVPAVHLPSCPADAVWDTAAGACIPRVALPSCPTGQLWDPETQTCSSSKLWFWGMLGGVSVAAGVMALASVWRGT